MFKFLAGLSTRTKLTAILVSLMVPVAMLFYFDVSQSITTIRFAHKEDLGNDWARPLVDAARNLAEHRDHVVRVAAGHDDERAEMMEHQGLVEESVKQLDELARQDVGGLTASVGWNTLREEVLKVVTADVKTPDSFKAHNEVTVKVLDAIRRLAGASGLSLDPDPDSFALVDATIVQLPTGLQSLALARRHFDTINDGDTSSRIRMQLGEELGIAETRMKFVFSDLIEDYAAVAQQDKQTIAAAEAAKRSFESLSPKLRALGRGEQMSTAEIAAVSHETELLTESLAELQDMGMASLEAILNKRVSREKAELYAHIGVTLLCVLLAVAIMLGVSRYLISQVGKANGAFASMAQGRFDTAIGEQARDELGTLLNSLAKMQSDLRARLEAEREVAQSNSRIRQSLDATSSNVMVADENNEIIYMNHAVKQLMASSQQEFRRTLPNFDATKLVGTNIDSFHANPAHQRGLLSQLTKTYTAEMKVGGKMMRIIASPIIDEAGKRLGTVVEWADRTQELAVEAEVQVIVAEALQGNLDRRIDLEGKAGFFKALSTGINELVANMATVVNEVRTIVTAANDGNLSHRVELGGKSGLLVKIGTGVNELTANMESVVNEVQALVTAANEGDLTRRVATEGKSGLLVKVGTGINQLADNMSGIVSLVKEAAGEVSKGADEMSQGNTNLSQRTEEQASSLEETASSMEEMTSTVKQNADNAGQANQLAVAARDQAEKGGAVVAKAVRAMTDINDASKKIADIIGVIDEIAFQTNLLALNAAVEAARAGEQGRGFAVVASEVRNLASRSATAAKEIKTLIQDSVRKVDEGSSLVTQSGVTLEQIVAAVKRVTDIVAEISAASNEQSSGIEQVNKAVMQLDELTQQNAALVEEASAASQSMADQARSLNASMQRYRVLGGTGGTAREPARVVAEPRSSEAERRRSGRPWTAAKATAPKAAPAVKSAAGDDAVWKEF